MFATETTRFWWPRPLCVACDRGGFSSASQCACLRSNFETALPGLCQEKLDTTTARASSKSRPFVQRILGLAISWHRCACCHCSVCRDNNAPGDDNAADNVSAATMLNNTIKMTATYTLSGCV
jgi:hypothetical protein